MELAERVKEFERLLKGCVLWPSGELETLARGVIEQALLTERRLAMEFCAEIAYETGKEHSVPLRWSDDHARLGIMWTRKEIARDIRAAAEKEVGK